MASTIAAEGNRPASNNNGVKCNLYIDHFVTSNKIRRQEFETCMRNNHRTFDRIITVRGAGQRTTFAEFFRAANGHTPGEINVVANLDVWFDPASVRRLYEALCTCDLICLSRWEKVNGGWELSPHANYSQDAWIFKTIMPERLTSQLDFPMGHLGCDNVFACYAMKCGLVCKNYASTIRCHHEHRETQARDSYESLPEHHLRHLKANDYVVVAEPLRTDNLRGARCVLYTSDPYEGPFRGRGIDAICCTGWPSRGEECMKMIERHKPDFVVLQIPAEGRPLLNKFEEMIKNTRKLLKSVVIVGWCGDIRADMAQSTDVLMQMDVGCSTTCSEGIFHLPVCTKHPATDIFPMAGRGGAIFIGSNYRVKDKPKFPLSCERISALRALKERFGNAFKIIGGGWGALDGKIDSCHLSECSGQYAGRLVGVDIPHVFGNKYNSDRLCYIQDGGCVAVTRNVPGLDVIHPFAKFYENISDLTDTVAALLERPDETSVLGRKACRYTKNWHSVGANAIAILQHVSSAMSPTSVCRPARGHRERKKRPQILPRPYGGACTSSFFNLLKVFQTPLRKFRMGSVRDGGYVVVDTGSSMLISAGVETNVDFEQEYWNRYGKPVVMFDGTIDAAPPTRGNIQFIRKNIGPLPPHENLQNYLGGQDGAMVKMDIEGAEWAWLASRPPIEKCSQIVIELHGMQRETSIKRAALKFLTSKHTIVHAHGNSHCGMSKRGVPNVLELTLVRNDLVSTRKLNSVPLPDPLLDSPNLPGEQELPLDYPPFYYNDANGAAT